MQAEKEREGSFVNDELNTAFVDGELNKTVNPNGGDTDWNLMDDLQELKDQEGDEYNENLMQEEKDTTKQLSYSKNIGGMESSIHFQQNGLKSTIQTSTKVSAEEDDDDLKDLLCQVFKPNKK